jgi:hypothetical protein
MMKADPGLQHLPMDCASDFDSDPFHSPESHIKEKCL